MRAAHGLDAGHIGMPLWVRGLPFFPALDRQVREGRKVERGLTARVVAFVIGPSGLEGKPTIVRGQNGPIGGERTMSDTPTP